jgi:hypothetical protein
MPGVVGTIQMTADIRYSGGNIGGSSRTEDALIQKAIQFQAGNAALGLADVMYHAVRTLAPSANEDRDLSGLLTDPFGNVVTQAEICALIVTADAANTNNVILKPAAANGFLGPFGAAANTLAIEPGAWINLNSVKGWAVTGGTGDLINLANSGAGTPVTYEILVVGRTIVG